MRISDWSSDVCSSDLAGDMWHRTGDVGVLNESGDLALRGRVHDVFKSGGYNIYPAEIEAELETHSEVRQAAVIGVEDAIFGTVAVAFIVPQHDSVDGAARGLFLRERFATYTDPHTFSCLKELHLLPVCTVAHSTLKPQWEASGTREE